MTIRLPNNAKMRPGFNPWVELKKHVNELYWGDREREGPPAAKATAYRSIVVLGCVITQDSSFAGELMLTTGGAWAFDDKQPETALALADALRSAADALEKEVGS